MNLQGTLTARDLLNYAYCARIPYFENVLHVKQATTPKEFAGRAAHRAFDDRSKRAKIVPDFPKLERRYGIWLEDAELCYGTVIDCILFDIDGVHAFPIQVKDSLYVGFLYRGQRMQVVSEALLVRRCLNKLVRRAYVKFLKSGHLIPVNINDESIAKVLQCLLDLKSVLLSERIPPPTDYRKRCCDCSLQIICRRA